MTVRVILDQHAEDAAFLWLLRDLAAGEPHYRLADLAKLDGRVEAQLDGLRVAAEPGWEIARQAMADIGEPGEVFAAGVLAFESGVPERVQQVIEVGTATPEASRGLISALGWLPYPQASKTIKTLLAAESTVGLRAGLAAMSAHRRNPGPPALFKAFASDDPLLKARALRAVGEVGLIDFQITARATTKGKDPACRFWAAWSSALLSAQRNAVTSLQDIAEAGGTFAERAAQMAMRRLAPKDAKTWLIRLVKELGQKRIALIAAGAFADPEAIPFLIDQMKVPKLARVAGESFSLITGADIAYEDLDGEKPEGSKPVPPKTQKMRTWPWIRISTCPGLTRRSSRSGGTPARATSPGAPATFWASPSPRSPSAKPSKPASSASVQPQPWSWPSSSPAAPCSRSAPRGGDNKRCCESVASEQRPDRRIEPWRIPGGMSDSLAVGGLRVRPCF